MFNADILGPLTATTSQSTVVAAVIEDGLLATASQSTVVAAIMEAEAAALTRPAITASKLPASSNTPVLAAIGSTPAPTAEWTAVPSSPGTYLITGVPALVEYVAIATPPPRALVLRADIEAVLIATISQSPYSEPQPINLPKLPATINTPVLAAIGSTPPLTVEWTSVPSPPGTYLTLGVLARFENGLVATASQPTVLPADIEDDLAATTTQQAVLQALIQSAPGPATGQPSIFPKLPATINSPLLAAIGSTPALTVEWLQVPSAPGTFSVTGLPARLEDGALMGQDRTPVVSATAIAAIAKDVYQLTFEVYAPGDPLRRVSYRIFQANEAAPSWTVADELGSSAFSVTLTIAATIYDGVIAEILATDVAGTTASLTRTLVAVVPPPPPPDTTPPTAPPFLYVIQLPDASWLFTWGASSDDVGVDHYQIDQVDSNGDLITNLAADIRQNYFVGSAGNIGNDGAVCNYYRVRAFDLAGNVSPSSPIAQGVASLAAQPQISEVLAQQLPGTTTIQATWSVAPAGTSCIAQIVDALDRPVGAPATSTTGQASLTLPVTTSAGLYRVKVNSS